MYIGDFALGSTFDLKFTSRDFFSGAPFTLANSPVISAYLDNNTTQLTAGITLTVDFDSVTGLNNVRVVATSGNGYATATNYQLVVTTGTVNGISVVGEVIGQFSIEARSDLRPTVAGRTLDVSAGGEAGLDWANIGSPTTANNLSGTSTKALEPTTASRTLDVTATGEAGIDWSNIGAPTTAVNLSGTSTKAVEPTVAGRTLDVSAGGEAGLDWANIGTPASTVGLSATTIKTATDVETDTQDIQSRLPASLVSGRMDSSVGAIVNGTIVAATFAANALDAVWSTTVRTLTAFAFSVTINSASVQAIWDALTSVLTTVGSIGKLLVDNINATISSRLASANISLTGGAVTVGTNNDKSGYSIGVGGIASTAFAAGAIDSAALDTTAGQEIADRILLRGLQTGADGPRTVQDALRTLRNRVQITVGGVTTVYEEDDTTSAWTAVATRNALADPITEIDPT